MKKIKYIAFLFSLLVIFSFTQKEEKTFIVIVNNETSIEGIDISYIEDLYLGDRTHWKKNKRANPTYLGEEFLCTNNFLNDVLQMNYNEFKKLWIKNIFSGNGVAPKSFNSSESLIQFVIKTRGAVGIISVKDYAAIKGKVKIITL
mgnify:CR=1 FL=1